MRHDYFKINRARARWRPEAPNLEPNPTWPNTFRWSPLSSPFMRWICSKDCWRYLGWRMYTTLIPQHWRIILTQRLCADFYQRMENVENWNCCIVDHVMALVRRISTANLIIRAPRSQSYDMLVGISFGGFTEQSWESEGYYSTADKAFLFSLNNHSGLG